MRLTPALEEQGQAVPRDLVAKQPSLLESTRSLKDPVSKIRWVALEVTSDLHTVHTPTQIYSGKTIERCLNMKELVGKKNLENNGLVCFLVA